MVYEKHGKQRSAFTENRKILYSFREVFIYLNKEMKSFCRVPINFCLDEHWRLIRTGGNIASIERLNLNIVFRNGYFPTNHFPKKIICTQILSYFHSSLCPFRSNTQISLTNLPIILCTSLKKIFSERAIKKSTSIGNAPFKHFFN